MFYICGKKFHYTSTSNLTNTLFRMLDLVAPVFGEFLRFLPKVVHLWTIHTVRGVVHASSPAYVRAVGLRRHGRLHRLAAAIA